MHACVHACVCACVRVWGSPTHPLVCPVCQVCQWLRESAELFLQNHTDIGHSEATAEDLLTEHQEFQIRAKVRTHACLAIQPTGSQHVRSDTMTVELCLSPTQRTATEVTSLLQRSEEMLAAGHPNSQQLRDTTADIRTLHSNFETRFINRAKLLRSTMEFYRDTQEVGVASGCGSVSRHIGLLRRWVWLKGCVMRPVCV